MLQAIVVVVTVAVLSAYGWFLKWSIDTGNWRWAFPVGIGVTACLYFLVTNKAERAQGNAEVMQNLRRWKRGVTSLLGR